MIAPSPQPGSEESSERFATPRVEMTLPQKQAIESKLKSLGAIEAKKLSGKETLVVDIDKVMSVPAPLLRVWVGRENGKFLAKREVLIQYLSGKVGISREAYMRGDRTEKPILYIPESVEAATTMMGIKNADFQTTIWELCPNVSVKETELAHPIQGSQDQGLSQYEAKYATFIFHPQYGDAFRDEKGALQIRDKTTRKYKPFSFTAMRAYGTTSNKHFLSSEEDQRTMQKRIDELFPHLVANKLIDPLRDARELTARGGQTLGEQAHRKVLLEGGFVTLNGVRHYISKSKEIASKEWELIQFTPQLAGLADPHTGTVLYTFRVFDKNKDQAEIKNNSNGKGTMFYRTSGDQVGLRSVSGEALVPKRPHETSQQHELRVLAAERGIQSLLKMCGNAPQLTSLLQDKGSNAGQLEGTARFIGESDTAAKEGFAALATKFGEEGLAQRFFSAYSDLIHSADDCEDTLRSISTKDIRAEVREEIIAGVRKNILSRAQSLLSDSVHTDNPEEVASMIQSFSSAGAIFASACKALRAKGELSLEDIKDGSLSSLVGQDINGVDADTMMRIQKERYAGKYSAELQEELDGKLKEAIGSRDSQFFIYRKGDEIISFMRFDPQPEYADGTHKYAASFMTDPRFEGGNLGKALLELIIQKQRESGVTLHADCDPSLFDNLYKNMGFEFVRQYQDRGADTYEIVLRPLPSSLAKAA